MEQKSNPQHEIRFNLGTFQGFNFKTQSPICRMLTAKEVLHWNHDAKGEAEFYPSGDCSEVSLVFSGLNAVCSSGLIALDRLLGEIGEDSKEIYLRIYVAVNIHGERLESLTASSVQDINLHIFYGESFLHMRREAAFELFELYHPEAYQAWEKSTCDGLIFDTDRFLDSPSFYTEEIKLNQEAVLLVAPQ